MTIFSRVITKKQSKFLNLQKYTKPLEILNGTKEESFLLIYVRKKMFHIPREAEHPSNKRNIIKKETLQINIKSFIQTNKLKLKEGVNPFIFIIS